MTTTEQNQAQGALVGLKVLDFGQYIPGPMLGMLLSDQGAEVIKVELPGGDPARSEPAFATWNRGKRSIVLDLKTPDGQANAVALAKQADIVIENYRPGVADRLGIGYEALSKANPQLLYCSISLCFHRHLPALRRDRRAIVPAAAHRQHICGHCFRGVRGDGRGSP